jgi:hypothetical protein
MLTCTTGNNSGLPWSNADMTTPPEIFEDPRSKPRAEQAGSASPVPQQDTQPLPEAEEDWYLKRKPAIAYIGQKSEVDQQK